MGLWDWEGRRMRGKTLVVGLFTSVTLLSGATACAHSGMAAGDIAPQNVVGLQVRNDNYLDVDVFALTEGVRTRLGMVTGSSTRNFLLPGTVITEGVSILATPIGGSGSASSGSLNVAPGQTVEFRIGTLLTNSSVYIR